MIAPVTWLITCLSWVKCASVDPSIPAQRPGKLTRRLAKMKASFLCASFANNLAANDGRYIPAHTYSKALETICEEKDFRFRERLGTGAFGQVFRGVHVPTGTHLALKKITRSANNSDFDPEHVMSLIRNEECIHARLDHPTIAKFHCTFVKGNGDAVMVMELIEGVNLLELVNPTSAPGSPIGSMSRSDSVLSEEVSDEVESEGFDTTTATSVSSVPQSMGIVLPINYDSEKQDPPPSAYGSRDSSDDSGPLYTYAELRLWSAQLVKIIAYLHSMDIIYADIKLENLMVDVNDNLRLIDFGLAYWWSGSQRLMNGLVGTPMYMSPEHLLSDGALITPACDWYSVGLVLYEMLYKRDPFAGSVVDDEDIEVYMEKLRVHVTSTQLKCPKSEHPKMTNLIERLTTMRPEERLGYDTDLELRALNGHPPATEPSDPRNSKELTDILAHPWFHR